MKNFSNLTIATILLLCIASCSKETEDKSSGCKTCKAFGSGTTSTVSMQVCSEAEEQSFRIEFQGREIMCN